MYKFEEQKQSWFKRRDPSRDLKKVLEKFEVIDFEKISGHRCQMKVTINGEEMILTARVTVNETYEMMDDGSTKVHEHGWGVQGTNPHGISVNLKLIEE